jgi:hypothetical protein
LNSSRHAVHYQRKQNENQTQWRRL